MATATTTTTTTSLETMLQKHLADLFAVYMKVYKFHWNLKGGCFIGMHTFYGDVFDRLADMIDETAERMRQLRMYAPCSLMEYAALTKVQEVSGFSLDFEATVAEVHKDLSMLEKNLLELYTFLDEGSLALLSNHELILAKDRWQLESSM